MSDTCFYIGNRNVMLPLRAPSVTMPSTKVGYANKLEFINGGASVRRSQASHKTYVMTWNSVGRDDIRPLLDLADGLYGTGSVYIHDPFAADRNALPQWWASPSMGLTDGLPLTGEGRGTRVGTAPNTLNFPTRSIEYTVVSGEERQIWIPIPTGHTAHVGAYGIDGTGGEVVVTPTTGPLAIATPVTLTLMDVTDDSRFNATFAASSGYTGILLSLGGSGTIILSGLMVQVLEDGITPETGGFISGQGNSGLSFISQPQYTPYSAAIDKVGVIAEFAETGGWEK